MALLVQNTSTPAFCSSDPTGTLTIWANGGAPTYLIRLYSDPPHTNLIGTSTLLIDNEHYTFTALAPGNYYYNLSDSGAGATNGVGFIDHGEEIDFVATPTDCSVFGASDGIITVSGITGGIGPYVYKLNAGSYGSGTVFSGLTAGTYSITAQDTGAAGGCTKIHEVTVGEPASSTISDIEVFVQSAVLCNGNCNGVLQAVVSGTAVGTMTFAWTKNAIAYATTQTITNVCAGTYIVTVTDENGPVASDPFVFEEPTPVLVQLLVESNISCFGGTNGEIDIDSTTGGTPPYTYFWTGPNGFTSTNNILFGVPAGTYTVTATDSNGCTDTDTVTLTQPTDMTSIGGATNVTCFGGSDGTISLNITGGPVSGTYSYSWVGGEGGNTPNVTGLLAGIHSVIVTKGGCHKQFNITISQPGQILISGILTNPTVSNPDTGSITTNIQQVVDPYTVLWDTGQTTQNITGLSAGTYTIVVTDENGCTSEKTFILTTDCDEFSLTEFKVLIMKLECCLGNKIKQHNKLIRQGREDLADKLLNHLYILRMILNRFLCIDNPGTLNCWSCTDVKNLMDLIKQICDCDCCDEDSENIVQVTWNPETDTFDIQD